MGTVIILTIIAVYSCWIIYRRYRQIKEGKYCGCHCEGCSKADCTSKDRN